VRSWARRLGATLGDRSCTSLGIESYARAAVARASSSSGAKSCQEKTSQIGRQCRRGLALHFWMLATLAANIKKNGQV
jgi:hypothetical protein